MKTVAHWVVAGTLSLGVGAVVTPAQNRPAQRYPLGAEAIVRALHADGLEVQVAEVRMPAPVSAAVQSPALELFGADRLPNGHVRMRLRCRQAAECLPFSVTLGRADAAANIAGRIAAPDPASHSLENAHEQIASASIPLLSPAANGPLTAPAPVFFPAGAKLTMLMEDGHMHIHLPVIALDSSAAGSEVRVCTPDHKRTFRATVVDATTVRGIVE